jgi:hypothetical protein
MKTLDVRADQGGGFACPEGRLNVVIYIPLK